MNTTEIRDLIKTVTGYNARQVSVRSPDSPSYVTVTVRDPNVNLSKVEAAVAKHNTWRTDGRDGSEGQSIRVETTSEVDAAHAGPHVQMIKDAVQSIIRVGLNGTARLTPTVVLFLDEGEAFVQNMQTYKRSARERASDVRRLEKYSIEKLALHFSRVR